MSMKISCNFQVRTVGSCATVGTGLWMSPDAPQCLEASALKNVQTLGQHRSDARLSYSESEKKLDFMFRHGSWNNNHPDGRATPSGHFSGFQEDFRTRLNVFIITLCSSIELRQNWCRWKTKKKSYNLNVWTAARNLRILGILFQTRKQLIIRTPFACHPDAAQRTPIFNRIRFFEAYK
jgi:hypothetical protein